MHLILHPHDFLWSVFVPMVSCGKWESETSNHFLNDTQLDWGRVYLTPSSMLYILYLFRAAQAY